MKKPEEMNLMERTQEARLRAGIWTPSPFKHLNTVQRAGSPTKHGKSTPKPRDNTWMRRTACLAYTVHHCHGDSSVQTGCARRKSPTQQLPESSSC